MLPASFLSPLKIHRTVHEGSDGVEHSAESMHECCHCFNYNSKKRKRECMYVCVRVLIYVKVYSLKTIKIFRAISLLQHTLEHVSSYHP